MNVSREFLDNFNLVISYYGFSDDEIKNAKDAVRRNYDLAKRQYEHLADWVKIVDQEFFEEFRNKGNITVNVSDLILDEKNKPKGEKRRV